MKIKIRFTDGKHRDYNVSSEKEKDADFLAEQLMQDLEREGHEILDFSVGEDWETL